MSARVDPYIAWERGDVVAAFREFRALAEGGDESSFLNLGYFYDVGSGTTRNPAKAMLWYRRAYENGAGAAASNIATVYRDLGKHRLAFAWYVRASRLHDGDAVVEIAKRYLSGVGVRRNQQSAISHLKRAARHKFITQAGREEAEELLESIG